MRRFNIVLVSLYFTKDSPLSGVERSYNMFKVFCLLFIQMGYLVYIHAVRPHNDSIFNTLEFINEYCMMALAYLMLKFVNLVQIWDYETQAPQPANIELNTRVEYAAIAIILLMAVLNFLVMIRISVGKLYLKCK